MDHYARFTELSPVYVKPQGWLLEFLQRQRDGMSGHFKALGYPFDTCMWTGQIEKIHLNELFYPNEPQDKEYQTWWPYEQCAYLLDALVRLGLLLDDDELLTVFRKNLEYVLTTADEKGHLAAMAAVDHSEWPMTVFFRAVMAWQGSFPDTSLIDAFHRHYQSLSVADLAEYFRNITNLEGLLAVAAWTDDAALVEKAEEAYQRFNTVLAAKHLTDYYDEIGMTKLNSGQKIVTHGVTGCEEIKLPVLLYIATGKTEYLDAAVTGMEKLLHDHLLPSGVPSSEEYFAGTGATRAYESCVIADFTWSLGYFLLATGEGCWGDRIEQAVFNALPGSITKDFTALQYLSSGNQVIMDGFAHKGAFLHGITSWRQYRANHFPQCCPANLQRTMPNYLARMWLQTADGAPVAAMFGPSVASFNYRNQKIRITERTEYPFEEVVRWKFELEHDAVFPFTFRVPEWCAKAVLRLNGQAVALSLPSGKFATLERNYSSGDELELVLPMRPEMQADRHGNLTMVRGPLVFSYPVPSEVVREREDNRFSPLRVYPKAPWDFALAENSRIIEVDGSACGYPFDPDSVRLKLRVTAETITGYDELEAGRYTPDIPEFYHLRKQSHEIELIPFGATMARITTFPVAEARQMLPVVTAHVLGPWKHDFMQPLERVGKVYDTAAFYALEPAELQPDRNGFYDLIHHFRLQGELAALVQLRIYSDIAGEAVLGVGASDRAILKLNDDPLGKIESVGCAEFLDLNYFSVQLCSGYNYLQVMVADGPNPSQYRDSWGVKVCCFRRL